MSGFDEAPNTTDKFNIEKNNKSKLDREKENTKIKIDIDSVERLIGALKFTAANLEKSVEKVDKVNHLAEILELLKKIDKKEYEDAFTRLSKNLEKSTAKIEKQAVQNLETAIQNNLSNISKTFATAANKYKEYAEVFDDPDVIETFEEIKELQKFRKTFKFKSILLSSILTATITLIVSFVGYTKFYSYKLEVAKKEIYKKNKKIMSVMKYAKNVQVAEDKNVRQLQFNNPKMSLLLLKDGTMVVQVDKRKNVNNSKGN